MARRHELSDAGWSLVEPRLPPPSRGRAWADHRRTVNGVLFRASTGIQWRELPNVGDGPQEVRPVGVS